MHDYTPATKDTIKLKFTNSEATGYAEQENDYGKHEYEILDAYKKAIDYADTDEHIIKRIYVSRCKHCGKIKKTVI